MKALILIFATLTLMACPKGTSTCVETTVDSTAVVTDTIVADTAGVDSVLLND